MIGVQFGFDRFKVENCRSKGEHNDSDWLTLTVTNGQTALPNQTKLIDANLHAGNEVNSFFMDPVNLDENKLTTDIFAVVNLSHTDDQGKNAEEIGLAISVAVAAASGGILGAAGEITDDLAARIGGAFLGVVGRTGGSGWSSSISGSICLVDGCSCSPRH
jgi:hypothetical protein